MFLSMAAEIESQSFHANGTDSSTTRSPHLEDSDSPKDPCIFVSTPCSKSKHDIDASAAKANATEVLTNKDPRLKSFKDAIAAENKYLSQKQVFKEDNIPKRERKNLNILRSRNVLALKKVGTLQEEKKARLVV